MGRKKIKLILTVVFILAGACCIAVSGCTRGDSTTTSSASGSAK